MFTQDSGKHKRDIARIDVYPGVDPIRTLFQRPEAAAVGQVGVNEQDRTHTHARHTRPTAVVSGTPFAGTARSATARSSLI